MWAIRIILVMAVAIGLSACGGGKFRTYNGPAVTSVQVHKSARKMYLLHDAKVLKTYDVDLGTNPLGHKQFEGDGKTPEGAYYITHRNPKSRYYLSLGISYPNAQDRAYAAAQGREPGGEIFIHGASGLGKNDGDWTIGCVAVTNREMELIYAMIKPGTVIHILP